jgi:hypothetical protein
VLDYFTPFNQDTLSANDVDLGSSGVVILPDGSGPSGHPNLALATGKTGFLYLLDQSNLGKFSSVSNQDVQEVPVQSNSTQVVGGIFGQPAFWNGNVYVAAVGDVLKQFTLANGALSQGPIHQSGNTFDLRGTTPVISANGATGIVWALDVSAYPTGPAVLYAYDAANVSNPLFVSPGSGAGAAGLAVKFTVPTIANGKVYVGGQGTLSVFGLKANDGIRVSDDFNRANVNPIVGAWSTPAGGANGGAIFNNQLIGGGGAFSDNFIQYNADTPPANHYAKIKFISTTNKGSDVDDGGPCVRFDINGNGYCFNIESNNPFGDTTWRLFSVAVGHGTLLNVGTVGRALVSGDIVECRVVGSLVSGYINGVLQGSATDTTYASGGAYGIHIFGNGGVWDDFEGGETR